MSIKNVQYVQTIRHVLIKKTIKKLRKPVKTEGKTMRTKKIRQKP